MTKILVTRPERDARGTADRLRAIGFEVVVAPLLVFAPIAPLAWPDGPISGVIVTSANGVRALKDLGVVDKLAAKPVFAVGDKTADAARAAGFGKVQSAGGAAEDLVALIGKSVQTGDRLLYSQGREVSHNLAHILAPSGIEIVDLPAYEMKAIPALPDAVAKGLRTGEITAVTLYSKRTAEVFAALSAPLLSPAAKSSLRLLCLSHNVAQPLVAATFTRIALADHPSEEAMLALALSHLREHS